MHKIAENVYLEVGSGEPIESENLVEFHLLYSGPLHSNGSPKEKHEIRRVFHSQLLRLWQNNKNLRSMAIYRGRKAYGEEIRSSVLPLAIPRALTDDEAVPKGLIEMGKNWARNGFNFVPLVTSDIALRCSLDILFLRAEEKNYVLQAGDLDGRIKTLFDALRMIREGNEIPANVIIESDERPLCVLLENDDLISQVKITADGLLRLPDKPFSKHDVYLQITVTLNSTTGSTWII